MVLNILFDLFLWVLAIGIWGALATLPAGIEWLTHDRIPRPQRTTFAPRWMVGRKLTPIRST
jgi:hypothetical protein